MHVNIETRMLSAHRHVNNQEDSNWFRRKSNDYPELSTESRIGVWRSSRGILLRSLPKSSVQQGKGAYPNNKAVLTKCQLILWRSCYAGRAYQSLTNMEVLKPNVWIRTARELIICKLGHVHVYRRIWLMSCSHRNYILLLKPLSLKAEVKFIGLKHIFSSYEFS